MTRAPSVSFSPVEWLCSCVSVSFFLLLPPVSVLSLQQHLSPAVCSLACWPLSATADKIWHLVWHRAGSVNIFPLESATPLFFGGFWFYSDVYNTRTLCHMFWLFSSPCGFVNQMKSPAVLQKPFSMATNHLTEWKRRTHIQLLFRAMTERAVRSSVLMISSCSSFIIPVLIALPVLPPT